MKYTFYATLLAACALAFTACGEKKGDENTQPPSESVQAPEPMPEPAPAPEPAPTPEPAPAAPEAPAGSNEAPKQ